MLGCFFLGNLRVELLRYKTDSRSIPILGNDSGVTVISSGSEFSVTDGNLVLKGPENTSVTLGTHMQYKVWSV